MFKTILTNDLRRFFSFKNLFEYIVFSFCIFFLVKLFLLNILMQWLDKIPLAEQAVIALKSFETSVSLAFIINIVASFPASFKREFDSNFFQQYYLSNALMPAIFSKIISFSLMFFVIFMAILGAGLITEFSAENAKIVMSGNYLLKNFAMIFLLVIYGVFLNSFRLKNAQNLVFYIICLPFFIPIVLLSLAINPEDYIMLLGLNLLLFPILLALTRASIKASILAA